MTSASDHKKPATAPAYRVLARKYRPRNFEDLVGQEVMVRTLRNAFETGRIAQAYMLTGVRGIGKTTTARLIARALNYDPAPSVDMTEMGAHCQAILESRHVDVIEMDAATHNGVEDIREINDAVRYKPASARYKVYIIDEVHMLSKPAFNAILKTLEEPPEHVKFIFATTEIRKVPVTVLSRCQRFDLRRLDGEVLISHLEKIAGLEQVEIDQDALALLARAAEGSVRDGLSLLDQAIAYGDGKVGGDQVGQMLGLVDRSRVIALFSALMTGDIVTALAEMQHQYDFGADPQTVLNDLAHFIHWVTKVKLVPAAGDDALRSQDERTSAKEFAAKLSIPVLSRAWQMMLKGLNEVKSSNQPLQAAEMVLIRLAHASALPTPGDLVARYKQDGPSSAPSQSASPSPSPASGASASVATQAEPQSHQPSSKDTVMSGSSSAMMSAASPLAMVSSIPDESVPDDSVPANAVATSENTTKLDSFAAILNLVANNREVQLKNHLERLVRPVSVQQGHVQLQLEPGAPAGLVGELTRKLNEWTGEKWLVSITKQGGAKTVIEHREEARAGVFAEAGNEAVVKTVLELFPDAEVIDVKDMATAALSSDDAIVDDGEDEQDF